MRLLYQNNPWSFLPKDHSSTAYCALPNAPLLNLYICTFVHTRVIFPCHIFGPCSSVRVPLSPDRGLPLSPNSVLHVRPQISTECPPPFIVGLILYVLAIHFRLHTVWNSSLGIFRYVFYVTQIYHWWAPSDMYSDLAIQTTEVQHSPSYKV